ncbi:hypothetical protein PR048_019517 [Dryococelus australis]|uniref:Uncharacterized protein n=1 Tax=Dryococelus australis TaxID=614101 RepID=A0ABQ9H3P4_9NEOP|nr:hypothetical protein PR048_019517 [Dryococelus australis]
MLRHAHHPPGIQPVRMTENAKPLEERRGDPCVGVAIAQGGTIHGPVHHQQQRLYLGKQDRMVINWEVPANPQIQQEIYSEEVNHQQGTVKR